MITIQASVLVPPPRHGPNTKPVAQYTLYSLQLIYHDSIPITTTADGLLVQFKANNDYDTELDSDSSYDICRPSYIRE